MQGRKETLFWIDLLRTVTSFAVIMIHVTADVITEWGAVPEDWWWTAHVCDSLVRGCVPVFIMISGALLLQKQESLTDFFRKRFSRIVLPLIAWTLFYLLWRKHFYEPGLDISGALRKIASGTAHFHLWFLYLLTGLYLVTPIFRIWTAHATFHGILYFLLLWLTVGSFLPFAEKLYSLLTGAPFHIQLPVEPAQGFIGYFVLGYFLHRFSDTSWIRGAGLAWLGSLAVCVFGTFWLTSKFHGYRGMFYDNLAPNVVFYTASFFILVKNNRFFTEQTFSPALQKTILILSRASFGIYLLHPMLLDALAKGRFGFSLSAMTPHPILTIPLTTGLVYFVSAAAILGLQKIPGVRRIV